MMPLERIAATINPGGHRRDFRIQVVWSIHVRGLRCTDDRTHIAQLEKGMKRILHSWLGLIIWGHSGIQRLNILACGLLADGGGRPTFLYIV